MNTTATAANDDDNRRFSRERPIIRLIREYSAGGGSRPPVFRCLSRRGFSPEEPGTRGRDWAGAAKVNTN